MLEPKDLRIGNWVQVERFSDGVYWWANERVESIDTMYVNEMPYKNVKEIELTEDILIKAGFKKEQYVYDSFLIKNIGIRLEEGCLQIMDDTKSPMMSIDLKYIHQLQNAYYVLYQEELDINLTSE